MGDRTTQKKILELLEEDATASHREIADSVGVSEPTVRKYINEMEENETIIGYSVDVNPKKVGERMAALIGINTHSDRYLEVAESLKEVGAIRKLYTSSGDHDLLAEVVAEDNTALHELVSEEITSLEGVDSSHPAVLLQRIK